jgi:hypothetical protein
VAKNDHVIFRLKRNKNRRPPPPPSGEIAHRHAVVRFGKKMMECAQVLDGQCPQETQKPENGIPNEGESWPTTTFDFRIFPTKSMTRTEKHPRFKFGQKMNVDTNVLHAQPSPSSLLIHV